MLDINHVDSPQKLWDFVLEHTDDEDVIDDLTRVFLELQSAVQQSLDRGICEEYLMESRQGECRDSEGNIHSGFSFAFKFDSECRGVFLCVEDDRIVDFCTIDEDTKEIVDHLH